MSDSRRRRKPLARGRAFARAALLGNPSDGFGGKTLGVAFTEMGAEVTLGEGVCDDGARALVDAALARAGGPGRPTRRMPATVATEIPREVGLGGSSAIVIAAIRASCALEDRRLDPDEVAALALAAEREDLGIDAGPQDRLIQAYETLLYMDFSESEAGRCERLDPGILPPLFVAWRRDARQSSGGVHADLRRRYRTGDREARAVLAEIADLAAEGRRRLLEGGGRDLGELMTENVRLRGRIIDLDPRHLRLVEIAGALGAAANYAGSGGAIVGIVPAGATTDDLRDEFAHHGFELCAATPAA
jgi:glucuronokinase